MKCKNCGVEFSEGIFCPECGTKYDIESEQKLKHQKEKMQVEQELITQNAEKERIQQEKSSKMFNGILYDSIEEMNMAKNLFEEEERRKKNEKKQNSKALWSMILGIALYPLTMTVFLWFPAIIVSVILGIGALRGKTTKKAWAIIGLVLDTIFVLIIVLALTILSQSSDSTSLGGISPETISEDKPEEEVLETTSEVDDSAPGHVRTIEDTLNEAIEAYNANKDNPKMSEDYSPNFSFWNPEYRIFSTETEGRELTAVVHWDSPYCRSGEISFGYDFGEEYCYECFINDDWLCEFHVEDEAYTFSFIRPTSITYLYIEDMDGNILIEIPEI